MINRSFITGLKSTSLSIKEKKFLSDYKPWGIILFSRNIKSINQAKKLTNEIKKNFDDDNYPILIDQEGGRVNRLKSIQLELHADFIKVVETSRGSKLKEPEKNNIFTGEFWTGKSALELGLVDGIGNADQVLKEKFGDKVIIKNLEKQKGFIARKLSTSIQNPVDSLVNILEEKTMWQKFGL